MLQDSKIVSKNASRIAYRAQDALPGEETYALSPGDLLSVAQCASRWVAAKGKPRRAAKWHDLLACLHLTPKQTDLRFAFRPATYTTNLLACPACGSASDAKICRKCGQARRAKSVQKDWSGNAEFCAKWTAQAQERNQTIVKPDEHDAAQLALARLAADPAIAQFWEACDFSVWLAATWHDPETGLTLPLRALIAYAPKAKSDFGLALGDFKTPREAGHAAWTRQCFYAGYHVAAALALDIWNQATDEDRRGFYYVLSEVPEPYEPARRQLTNQFLTLGRKTYQRLLGLYAQCLKKRHWPGYDLSGTGDAAWTAVDLEPWMERGVADASAATSAETDNASTSHAE